MEPIEVFGPGEKQFVCCKCGKVIIKHKDDLDVNRNIVDCSYSCECPSCKGIMKSYM